VPTKARSVIVSGQELSPTHASLRSASANHDYYFELLFQEEEQDAAINYSTPFASSQTRRVDSHAEARTQTWGTSRERTRANSLQSRAFHAIR
jgi:hypothetical protein